MDIDHSGYGLGFRHLERSYLILLNLDRVLLANLRGVAVVGDRTAPLLRSLSRRDGLFPPHGHAVGGGALSWRRIRVLSRRGAASAVSHLLHNVALQ